MELKLFFMAMPVMQREAFAKRCETSRQHITNIAYGLKPCAEKLAIAIERESLGVVPVEDLRNDVDWSFIRNTKKKAA